ncbi:hypothetical protein PZ897_18225 [Hoeflea sp. YIM 152468]|uniref:hypothetical protein n=1 Tax=Hoeflea sp. YIM 152468 TaxID=3031759 RepID=UPI0023DCCBD5|nr:hypothetical protein [Hoeflea sp. YIM 152468]MDF1610123.1 hypothetical protein [Hoeflea sp. YIM 152468]
MIKLLVTGVWICGVALASVYFSAQMTSKDVDMEPAPAMFGGLETVRGEVNSIPVISSGAVQGYFLTRLSYTVDPLKTATLTVPVDDLITDALYTALVGEPVIGFPDIVSFDLDAFKALVLESLNARVGETLFHDVIVEQIDFLSKEDIRSNVQQGRSLKHHATVDAASDEPAALAE